MKIIIFFYITKYYKILNVDKDASPKTIRKAYKKFFRYHPGKGPDQKYIKKSKMPMKS